MLPCRYLYHTGFGTDLRKREIKQAADKKMRNIVKKAKRRKLDRPGRHQRVWIQILNPDLVRLTGFEPLAFGVGAERSIQLSYGRTSMKTVRRRVSAIQL